MKLFLQFWVKYEKIVKKTIKLIKYLGNKMETEAMHCNESKIYRTEEKNGKNDEN